MADDSINVEFGADTAPLLAGIERVKSQLAELDAAMRKFSDTGRGLGDDVAASVDRVGQAANEQIKVISATYKTKEELIQADYRSGQITLQQEVDDLVAAENEKWDALREYYINKQAAAQDDAGATDQVNAEVEIAWQQHQQRLIQIQQQASQQMQRQQQQTQRQWEAALRPMESAFTSAVNGMITGTQTFQQAMLRMGQSIVLNMVDNVIKRIVSGWIAGEVTKTAATGEESAARLGIESSDAIAGAAVGAATQKASILGHAASGAAAVYDDVAQIPYVGWLLAPPAAAAAFAAILAFGGDIPSFDVGAWNLPSDTLAMVHQGETILPSGVAADFRAAMTGGGGGGGGDTYNLSVNAIDTQTGVQFLKNNIGVIVSGLAQQKRNLNAAFAS